MDQQSTPAIPAGLLRRLAALVYDSLLVVALWFIATFALLPFTGGEAITPENQGALSYLYRGWLVVVAFGYFGLGWVRGGQTLGFRAWRIRLQSADGSAANWADAAVRFAVGGTLALIAMLGLWSLAQPGWLLSDFAATLMLLPAFANIAWIPFDRGGRSLQDLAGAMRVVRVPR